MKKPIVLIIALAVLASLGWWAMNLNENKGNSNKTELIDFAIKDVSTVDKVIITDSFGNSFEIRKNGDQWTDKDGGCIIQESAEFIIDAFKNIEFKGYLAGTSHEKFTNLMSAQHTKVEIFQDGKWTKTWYLGPASQDHYGQIMLLDSEEYGTSDIPVLMKIKGVNGIIEPRFFADSRKWMCTNIFAIPLGKLSKVDIKFNDEPERSFTVTKDGTNFNVYQQGEKLSNVDTNMILSYLHNYKKIHFDIPNYELSEKQVDSVKNTIPFCEITVTESSKKSTKLKCFRLVTKSQNELDKIDGLAEIHDTSRDRFWCELPNGTLVKCQYFVFNPLLMGHIYFPLDIEMLKTHDGILEK